MNSATELQYAMDGRGVHMYPTCIILYGTQVRNQKDHRAVSASRGHPLLGLTPQTTWGSPTL